MEFFCFHLEKKEWTIQTRIAHERWIKLQLTSFMFYCSSLCMCVCVWIFGLSGSSGRIINGDFSASQSNLNGLIYSIDLNIIPFHICFIFHSQLFFFFFTLWMLLHKCEKVLRRMTSSKKKSECCGKYHLFHFTGLWYCRCCCHCCCCFVICQKCIIIVQ